MDIRQLIEKAEQIKNKKNVKTTSRKLKIKRLEALGVEECFVEIEKPGITKMKLIEEKQDAIFSLAECIITPDLSNEELLKAYGVNNREALLKKIFTEEEIRDMVSVLGSMMTKIHTVEIVTDIKN